MIACKILVGKYGEKKPIGRTMCISLIMLKWIDSSGWRREPKTASCEHGNERLDSLKSGEIAHKLKDC
jgi:hypothetical protein